MIKLRLFNLWQFVLGCDRLPTRRSSSKSMLRVVMRSNHSLLLRICEVSCYRHGCDPPRLSLSNDSSSLHSALLALFSILEYSCSVSPSQMPPPVNLSF